MRVFKKLKSKLIKKVLKPLLIKTLFIVANYYIEKKMGCATTTLKFAVIVMNVLCAIFGALMLAASAYGLANFSQSELIQIPCAVGIVLGSLLFLTVIPGCVGPLQERVRPLWIYALSLSVLMIAQINVNIFYTVNFDTLATETMNYAWQLQFTGNNATMSNYEIDHQCCGVNGPKDYAAAGLFIPPQCYKNQNSTLTADLHTVGCATKLREEFDNSAKIELISDWTLVGVEGFTALLAIMLAINLKNVHRRKQFH